MKIVIGALAAVLAMWAHEIPKYYLTLYLTRPAFRDSVKIKGIWLKAIDPIGLILLVFMNVGWQMPLKTEANKLKDPKTNLIAICLFGLLVNLSVAMLALAFYRHGLYHWQPSPYLKYIAEFVFIFGYYNLVIMIINLIPVIPLDMTKVIYALSPNTYFKILQNGRLIQAGFVLALVFGFIPMLILPLFNMMITMIG